MTRLDWFAASVVLVLLTEPDEVLDRTVSVVLLKAEDFGPAFEKACEFGFAQEQIYRNANGERVRRAFEAVSTIDILPENLTSGVEVYHQAGLAVDDAPIPFEFEFDPLSSPPGQTGV